MNVLSEYLHEPSFFSLSQMMQESSSESQALMDVPDNQPIGMRDNSNCIIRSRGSVPHTKQFGRTSLRTPFAYYLPIFHISIFAEI